jgi:hydroxymethylglutaryl-CoA synthase
MSVRVGIEAMGLAVPEQYVDMAELAEARGVAPTKYTEGIGLKQMAVPGVDEDTVTLAVRAARMALKGVDLSEIGLCIVGTETGVDHSKPVASFVQGLLGLPSHCRVYETKHACYGGTAGLMTALDWIRSGSNRGRKALVIASDIARYGLRTPGEPTQGAGAVAMLISQKPQLVELDQAVGTYACDVMDFWRPLYSKDAYVDGQYSVTCYLDALVGAYKEHLALGGGPQPLASDRFAGIVYHVPYPKMAKKAHEALRTFDKDSAPADSFVKQVRPSLVLPERVGNIYTGSMYLSLLSVLALDPRNLDGQALGLFTYGSGCCAEFFSGRVTAGAQARVKALDLPGLLERRARIPVAEYERVMGLREGLDQKPLQADTRPGRYLGVEQDRRRYSKLA